MLLVLYLCPINYEFFLFCWVGTKTIPFSVSSEHCSNFFFWCFLSQLKIVFSHFYTDQNSARYKGGPFRDLWNFLSMQIFPITFLWKLLLPQLLLNPSFVSSTHRDHWTQPRFPLSVSQPENSLQRVSQSKCIIPIISMLDCLK